MKKDVFLSIPKDVTHGRGYVYSLRYHIVWCTKYRKQIFVSGLEEEVKKHRRCSCVVESKNKTPRAVKFENDNRDGVGEPVELNTPHNRGVLKILKGK